MVKYLADVVHLSTRPDDGDWFAIIVEARDASAAARAAAHIAAERRYAEKGVVGMISEQASTKGGFLAQIGRQARSESGVVTIGDTVSILVSSSEDAR